jgi:NTP pyrophosphatase (non-canonical NTP hydrolase)
MTEEFQQLTIGKYAAEAAITDQGTDSSSLNFPLLGLFGETGSLLSEVKKKQRDQASYLGYAAAVVEELGDVLWYLSAVARRGGIGLPDIVAKAHSGNLEMRTVDGESITFASLQPTLISFSQ